MGFTRILTGLATLDGRILQKTLFDKIRIVEIQVIGCFNCR
jgi:hypothetical protein